MAYHQNWLEKQLSWLKKTLKKLVIAACTYNQEASQFTFIYNDTSCCYGWCFGWCSQGSRIELGGVASAVQHQIRVPSYGDVGSLERRRGGGKPSSKKYRRRER
jgi:hypothetical protein